MALVTRSGDLMTALEGVYLEVLSADVVRQTIELLKTKDGGDEHADELARLESRLRVPYPFLPRMEAEGAARRLVDTAFFINKTFGVET